MALQDIRTHGKSSIADAVKAVPARPREYLSRSFVLVLGLPAEKWDRALSLAAGAFDSSFSADEFELSSELGISSGDAKHIINGASFFGAMLASHPEATPEEFVSSLVENSLLQEGDRDAALKFATVVAGMRVKLTEEFEKSTMRNALLPSLRRFETAVDVRLASSESTVSVAVPLVLLMVDTDADRETLWCQLSKHELKAIIAKLNKTLERFESAEEWLAKNDSRVG